MSALRKSLKTESHPSRRPPGELLSRPEKQQPLERPKSSFWSGLTGAAEEQLLGGEAKPRERPMEKPETAPLGACTFEQNGDG